MPKITIETKVGPITFVGRSDESQVRPATALDAERVRLLVAEIMLSFMRALVPPTRSRMSLGAFKKEPSRRRNQTAPARSAALRANRKKREPIREQILRAVRMDPEASSTKIAARVAESSGTPVSRQYVGVVVRHDGSGGVA